MSKYSILDVEKLWGSYTFVEQQPAYKDILLFLDTKKEAAMKKLKRQDDPVARATWQLVDKFYERIENLKKEVLEKQEREKENKTS